MSEQTEKMRSIWFFVGLLLLIIGAIVVGSGIFYAINKPAHPLKLYNLHPDIWWGGFMGIIGIIFLWVSRKVKVEG